MAVSALRSARPYLVRNRGPESESSDDTTPYPIIEWEYDGKLRTTKSIYDAGFCQLNEEVNILYSPDGKKAERVSFGNRYFISLIGFVGSLGSIMAVVNNA